MLKNFLQWPLAKKIALPAAALCFLSSSLLVLFSYYGHLQLIDQSTEAFGENLIQQLSRDASNPLVQDDKLSLQSLLNELVEGPMVVSSTIYDIENRPIAEAGTLIGGHSFSASITFQDSIAGYAVITLDNSALQRQASLNSWKLISLAALLAALVYILGSLSAKQLSIILNDLAQVAKTPSMRRKSAHIAYPGDDEILQLARAISLSATTEPANQHVPIYHQPCAIASIEFNNLGTLNPSPAINQLGNFRHQLGMICRLYQGQLSISRSNCFSLIFYADNNSSNYPFRALCCALLIDQWVSKEYPSLSLKIGLGLQNAGCGNDIATELAHHQQIEQNLLMTSQITSGLITSNELCQQGSVNTKIISTPQTNNTAVIEGLRNPYAELLDKQYETLNKNQAAAD